MNQQDIQKYIQDSSIDVKCPSLHPQNCNIKAYYQFKGSIKSLWGIFLIPHLIGLINRRKDFKDKKIQILKAFLIGYVKSMLYAGLTATLIRRLICFFTEYFRFDGHYTIIQGFLCGLPLTIQSSGRRSEIALYSMAKSLQMCYYVLRRRGIISGIQNGQVLIFGLAMGIIGYFYQHQTKSIKKSVHWVYSQFLGII